MKKSGVLNDRLARVIAEMGHTDSLVISDAGLPVPLGVERIDLAVSKNIPHFLDVLAATLAELDIEEAIIAEELAKRSPSTLKKLRAMLGDITVRQVPHEDFKELTKGARAVVRSGEFTPYANVILIGGVVY